MALASGLAGAGTGMSQPPVYHPDYSQAIYQPPPRVYTPPFATTGTVDTHIDGEFNGWTGNTVWTMDNGQVWQQSQYSYHYHYAYRPRVIIFQSNYKWLMHVDGVNEQVQVERIK